MALRRSKKQESARKGDKTTNTYNPLVQECVDFILSSTHDPDNIRHCGRCLLGALQPLGPRSKEGEEQQTMFETMPKIEKNDVFWRHIYNLLFVKRTPEEVVALMTRLSECYCDLDEENVAVYHAAGLAAEPILMDRTYMLSLNTEWLKGARTPERCALFIEIFFLLNAYLSHSGIKSVAKGEARRWPHNAAELLPSGDEAMIWSLLQWYTCIFDPIVFSLTGAITRVCRSLFIPRVIQFNITEMVVLTTWAHLAITIEGLRRLTQMVEEGKTLDESSLLVMPRFAIQATCVMNYLRGLDSLPVDIRSTLLRGSATKLMQLCTIMLYISSDRRFQAGLQPYFAEQAEFFTRYGQWVYRFFHMHQYPHPAILVHPQIFDLDKSIFPPTTTRRSTAEAVIRYIDAFRTDQRCSAHRCPNSIQSAGKAFQRCTGCNIVSYCGRECQKRAWREEEYPHKRICAILRTLIDAGGGPSMFYPVPNQSAPIPATELRNLKTYDDLEPYVLENWKKANVSEDLEYVERWGKLHDASREMPDGSECTPGFDQYDAFIFLLSKPIGPGSSAVYMDRLAKWPSEVAKEKQYLEVQAFWNEAIEC